MIFDAHDELQFPKQQDNRGRGPGGAVSSSDQLRAKNLTFIQFTHTATVLDGKGRKSHVNDLTALVFLN